jgi:hypothetical protein
MFYYLVPPYSVCAFPRVFPGILLASKNGFLPALFPASTTVIPPHPLRPAERAGSGPYHPSSLFPTLYVYYFPAATRCDVTRQDETRRDDVPCRCSDARRFLCIGCAPCMCSVSVSPSVCCSTERKKEKGREVYVMSRLNLRFVYVFVCSRLRVVLVFCVVAGDVVSPFRVGLGSWDV